jgi:alkanesulfonate monooxygenase SsuD/methylene tetrahydromethanopterin reductase-like flavin-dependent oxidoreductase (luciferase family)
LQATIQRPAEVLRDRLPIGSGQQFAEKLIAYREAGVQRVFIWPMVDEVHQLEAFAETVRPLLDA